MSRKAKISKALKSRVWSDHYDKYTAFAICPICNRTEIREAVFDAGHKISEANGGSTTPENLIPICASCNQSMGS